MDDMANAIYYWMEAYQYLPTRIETLYQIINHYRIAGKNILAHSFYEMADYERKKDKSIDHLFLEKDIYEYKLDYEFTILAYYRNTQNIDVTKPCMKVLAHPLSDEEINKNILSNYKFYTKSLKNMETPMIENNLRMLKSIGVNKPQIDKNLYVSSTPSLCIDTSNKNRLIVNVRYVSYRIDEKGGYSYDKNICTKNVVTTIDMTYQRGWTKGLEFELNYNKVYDDLYIGLEDVRIFSNNETIFFNANRGLGYNKMSIETGKIMLGSASASSHLIYTDDQKEIEKNWVLFKNGKRELKMIYGWYPLKIGDIEDDPEKKIDDKNQILKKLVITSEEETPNFFRWVRGSTNGITIDDEVWFICHLVSYEDRRYYYHLFVILDVNTMKLKRYSEMFNFEGEKVEYTLGFAYMEKEKQFLIGYSVMDRESKYMTVSRENVNSLFIR
jgi:hypothetical protein